MTDLNKLATTLFESIMDDETIAEMKERKMIACELGYKLSCIAVMQVELEIALNLEGNVQ